MKKLQLLSFALIMAITFSSCSKDEDPGTKNGDNTPTVPSEFTKKVLVEEFSGAWCGWCPDGADRLEKLIAENPNQVIGVTLHYGDAMQISNYDDIKNKFGVSGYPSGMVDRVPSSQDGKVAMSRGYWKSNAEARMTMTANTGLKIDATNQDQIKVTAAFNSEVKGDVRLTVYVLEDYVTGTGSGYNQQNYLSGRSGYESSPYYSQPSVIMGYEHMKTWRKVLSSETFGDEIPADKRVKGGTFEKTFALGTNNWNSANVSIVALVNEVGSSSINHEVLNAQKVKLGSAQNWD